VEVKADPEVVMVATVGLVYFKLLELMVVEVTMAVVPDHADTVAVADIQINKMRVEVQ
jgi:hypothetical protein